jgi:histidyl-tRNA synthetase
MTDKKRGVIPRKIKGFRDIDASLNQLRWQVIQAAGKVYRSYGFDHLDTPVLEYAECIGKYMPGEGLSDGSVSDGVYSFQNQESEPVYYEDGSIAMDEDKVVMDEYPLAMRYDLTAPLARVYAESMWTEKLKGKLSTEKSPLFRRYQFGPVYRNEAKLDPGRFREFWQLDFDTVGTADVTADAEVAMILADALEAIGLQRGSFIVKVNNRKVLKGFLKSLQIDTEAQEQNILRVIDKLDKIGLEGVTAELGRGRKDPVSGATISGLNLDAHVVTPIAAFFEKFAKAQTRRDILDSLQQAIGDNETSKEGLAELEKIDRVLNALGFDEGRVIFDPTLIRGMAYYTGPVIEVESRQTYTDEKGRERKVGSICGGGRYDGLVARMLGIDVPATGASIGVDRLCELLVLTKQSPAKAAGPVFICMFDQQLMPEYQQIARELRDAGIAAEVYYGYQKGLNKQLSYADEKNCPLAILLGGDEHAKGVVSIKNLKLGKEIAAEVTDKAEWNRRVQTEVARAAIVQQVKQLLG